MIETDNRRFSTTTRENRDEWLSDLAKATQKRDVYAERHDVSAYGAADAVRPLEANMTDRYATSKVQAPAQDDDYYYDDHDSAMTAARQDAYAEDGDPNPEWTYDEKRDIWVDSYGNPYVEEYPEGEEDRYAPAESEYLAPQADARRRQSKSRGGAVSLAAIVLVASIGGGLAYAWKKGGFIGSDLPGIGSAPPVIKASTDPIKIKPAETASTADQPIHEIFDRSSQTIPANERLVRHEEQPMAVVPVRQDENRAPSLPQAPNASRSVSTSEITLPQPAGASAADQTAVTASPTPLPGNLPDGPRQVKTIKIMPDRSVVTGEAPITNPPSAPAADEGTIASSNTPAAANEPTQIATTTAPPPTVSPPPSSTDVDSSAPSQAPAITSVQTAPVTTIPAASEPPVSTTTSDDASATTVAEPAPQPEAAPPAIPPVRPRNIPTTTTQVASAQPVVTSAASNGAYVVQVSSQKSPAEAQSAFQSLQRKFPSVLGGMKASIRKVDIPDRGTYYRVRVGSWGSSTDAGAFCAKLKAAGGDCVIARN